MRKVLLDRKITAARGAVPGIGDPDRHASNEPVERLSWVHIVVTCAKFLAPDAF
jgi:hypothetical protein